MTPPSLVLPTHLSAAHWLLPLTFALSLAPSAPAQDPGAVFREEAIASAEGRDWQPLWNQRDLTDFEIAIEGQPLGEDPQQIYQVVQDSIHVYRSAVAGSEMPMGVLATKRNFSDYRFRFEYRWGEKKFLPRTDTVRDAGLLYHVTGQLKVWPRSVECQVQEGDTGDVWTVFSQVQSTVVPDEDEYRYATPSDGGQPRTFGRMDGISRIIKRSDLEQDGWNTVEVIVRGDSALHLVNDEPVAFVTSMRQPGETAVRSAPLEMGKIAFQAECAEVFYRNLEIMLLED